MPISEYVLPGGWVRPEGIALGPDNDFFSGSSADGTIFRCDLASHKAEIWLPAGTDGRTVAVGMAVSTRSQLIVCGGRTGRLFVYDVATRALLSRRSVEGFLNDVWVVGNYAYATDSSQPVIWRFGLLSDADPVAIRLPDAGPDAYLNGIVSTADETALLVAAQGTEVLWRVELADGSARPIATDFAADGLLLIGNILIGVCNRGDTIEDAEFFLAALELTDGTRPATPIGEYTDPAFDTPTTLATDGKRLLIVNSQFARGSAAGPPFQVIGVELPFFH
jgi:Cu-Zn family superoxide dismutase